MWRDVYRSSFGAINQSLGPNTVCNIVIQRNDIEEEVEVQTIDLAFDAPLTIEWPEQSKEVPVCGSTATLRVICNNDREFLPLMMSDPGNVRLIVTTTSYELWRGVLDIRQCEEPYATINGYVVELSFTDFGCLDRIKFDGDGIMTGSQIVRYIVGKAGLSIDYSRYEINCSTTLDGDDYNFDQYSFRCDNFYDEDGVGMSCKEVLGDVLQPFMMKIAQFNGRIIAYDLKTLYDDIAPVQLKWMGQDQNLTFDKYVNHVKITFSTYCDNELQGDDVDLNGLGTDFNDDLVNLYATDLEDVTNPYFSWFPNTETSNVMAGRNNASFTMHIMRKTDGTSYDLDKVTYYDSLRVAPMHITALQGGEDSDGFVAKTMGNHLEYKNGSVNTFVPMTFGVPHVWTDDGQPIFKMKDIYVPAMKGYDANKFKIRIKMDMMVDPRYNPFSDAENNRKDNYDYCTRYHNHTFVKLLVQLRDKDGNVIAHYSNAPFLYNTRMKQPYREYEYVVNGALINPGDWKFDDDWRRRRYMADFTMSQGAWYDQHDWEIACPNPSLAPYCWLDYYDKSNVDEGCGVLGWSVNKQNVGSMAKMNPYITSLDDGQYIPYPSQGGYIHIEVMHGYHQWSNEYPWWPNDPTSHYDDKSIHVMYKLPKVDVVKSNRTMDDAVFDDVEIEGIVNDYGLDDMEISTNCGSSEYAMPTSKACVLSTNYLTQVKRASRGGYTDTLENLMVGTIYSQFHGHKIRLSGTAEPVYGLRKYRVKSEPGKYWMKIGEVIDVKNGTSEVQLVELCDETYQREQ